MDHTPYSTEVPPIRLIQNYCSADYATVRVTHTMVDKNNPDANENLRYILAAAGIVDYEALENGRQNGQTAPVTFIQANRITTFELRFYRVNNARGDRRFSIEDFRQKVREHEIEVGDLLYFCCPCDEYGNPHLYIFNLTHNTPSEENLQAEFGTDEIAAALEELRPRLEYIVRGGPFENRKGVGKTAPKDAGDTFEAAMDIETNNDPGADYRDLIEFKTKSSRTLDTLFSLRPCFDGTPVAQAEAVDRYRVSAFARLYGYESDKHPGMKSLYITIGSEVAPRNAQNFFLRVNYDAALVEIMRHEDEQDVVTAYWGFETLRDELHHKHPATLWVKATEVRKGTDDTAALFSFDEFSFTRAPQFSTFLSLIERGVVVYDWRGYTTPAGNYAGKNHGNAWRIDHRYRDCLFETYEVLNL